MPAQIRDAPSSNTNALKVGTPIDNQRAAPLYNLQNKEIHPDPQGMAVPSSHLKWKTPGSTVLPSANVKHQTRLWMYECSCDALCRAISLSRNLGRSHPMGLSTG